MSQAGIDSDIQGQEDVQCQYQEESQIRPESVFGTWLCQEVSARQQSASTALENLEQSLIDLCDAHETVPRRYVILEKLEQSLVAVKLEVQQKQAKIDQLEGENVWILNLKQQEGERLNVRMIEMTRKLQCENGAVIDELTRKFLMKEHELLTLQNQLAEKEKEQYQSTVKINHLQVELEQFARVIESLKAKHQLHCLRSNGTKLIPEKQNPYFNNSAHPEKRSLSLDQRIMKARDTRKHSTIHKQDKNYEHELVVELEVARIKSCSLQMDRMLEMQYGEVQKLLLRWKATGSDQITRIWTF